MGLGVSDGLNKGKIYEFLLVIDGAELGELSSFLGLGEVVYLQG